MINPLQFGGYSRPSSRLVLVALITLTCQGYAQDPGYVLRVFAPNKVQGTPGQRVEFEAVIQLTAAANPVQGWSLSVASTSPTLWRATTSGTVGAPVEYGGLRRFDSFEITEVIDPVKNGGTNGAVSRVHLSYTVPGVAIPARPPSPYDLLRMMFIVDIPTDGTTHEVTLEFVDGLIGTGEPHYNRLTVSGQTVIPTGICARIQVSEENTGLNPWIKVLNNDDSGPGSLRQAILDASPGDIITFTATLSGETIALTSGQLIVDKNLTIDASALPGGITIDGTMSSRILLIASDCSTPIVTLDSITFTRGSVGDDAGGAIRTQIGTTLIARRRTFHDNHADTGSGDAGAIYSQGQLRVENSTFTGNTAADRGGAVRTSTGTGTIQNVTITGNSALRGGGINNDAAILNLTNTIVAANSAGGSDPNIQGSIDADVNNLRSGDPLLAPLGHYGGPTQTMPPLPGSPAVDPVDGPIVSVFATDQRGYPRLSGSAVDVGAVEGIYAAAGPGSVTDIARLGDGSVRFTFTDVTGAVFPVLATTKVALPSVNWSQIGFVSEQPVGSGQFPFTDTQATNFQQRYYRVISP